jgi:hypothetical protein
VTPTRPSGRRCSVPRARVGRGSLGQALVATKLFGLEIMAMKTIPNEPWLRGGCLERPSEAVPRRTFLVDTPFDLDRGRGIKRFDIEERTRTRAREHSSVTGSRRSIK